MTPATYVRPLIAMVCLMAATPAVANPAGKSHRFVATLGAQMMVPDAVLASEPFEFRSKGLRLDVAMQVGKRWRLRGAYNEWFALDKPSDLDPTDGIQYLLGRDVAVGAQLLVVEGLFVETLIGLGSFGRLHDDYSKAESRARVGHLRLGYELVVRQAVVSLAAGYTRVSHPDGIAEWFPLSLSAGLTF